jgi:hypothetical protein
MSTLGKEESGSSIQTPQRSIFDVPAVAKEPISEEGFRSRLLKFIISSNQPFSLVEKPDFRELINYTSKQNPLVAVPSRRTLRTDLEKLYGQEKATLRKLLNSNESKISFTSLSHYIDLSPLSLLFVLKIKDSTAQKMSPVQKLTIVNTINCTEVGRCCSYLCILIKSFSSETFLLG